jgi:hypothetical protein
MPPDFGPGGPGGPGFGGPHFHHGPPHFMYGMDWWPAVGSLLMVLTIVAGLWMAGYGVLLAQTLLSGRREERTDMRVRWVAAVERHNAVAQVFARFECDATAVLATPALADVRQPPTARFVDAFAEAGALATEQYPSAEFACRFVAAVEREERAWAAAVAAAERSRDARFTPDERAVLEQARRLLEVVEASPFEHERHIALRKAMRKLHDLEKRTGWQLPAPASLALEERARGAIAA